MKTKWHLCILWSVLSLGLLSCAQDTYESPFARRKRLIKLAAPKFKLIRLSTTSDRKLPVINQPPLSQPHPPLSPPSTRPAQPRANTGPGFAYLPDVSVTCSTTDFVVRVKAAFYGLGADAEELTLGSTCKSTGVLRPYGDILFTYPLNACGAVRQSHRDHLVYKSVLHYAPSPKRFPSRAHKMDIDIECRFQRNHHVYQLTVQPTWSTAIVRKRLKGDPKEFQIQLMDDSWSGPAKSHVYQLGKPVNVQVSAAHVPPGGKLYISSCYASPDSDSQSPLKYTIIDKFGCMMDSRRDPGASQFIFRTDKILKFSLKAFQFTADPDTEVSVHCRIFVSAEDPGPARKSCTYRKDGWRALTGDDSICECCDSQCVTSKRRRAMMEGFASSGSLQVSDQPDTAEDDFLPVVTSSVRSHSIHELHSQQNLWGSADVVMFEEEEDNYDDDDDEEQDYTDEEEEQVEEDSGIIVGEMTEPDSEEFGFAAMEENETEMMTSNAFEEDGSAYSVQAYFPESEEQEEEEDERFGEREDEEQMNQKEVQELVQIATEISPQRELQPLVSDKGGDEDDRMVTTEVKTKNDEDLADEREMTWYFTWR